MLKRLAPRGPHHRLSVGSKTLSLDAGWSEPSVSDIEVALLRNAAFPELARGTGLNHEFVILDPSIADKVPDHEDLALRIGECAERMCIPAIIIGNVASERFGGGGFTDTAYAMASASDQDFADALAMLRERIGWVMSSSRFSQQRHIFLPVCDRALLAVAIELVAQLPPVSRPFVHLATWWDEEEMPNAHRFGPLERVGRAIHDLNGERATTFLYAWSRSLARRLTTQFGIPVQPLEAPPEIALAADADNHANRFTVGYFSSPRAESGFGRISSIVRAANRIGATARNTRFVVQVRPEPDGRVPSSVMAQKAELAAVPERNVSLIEELLPRKVYFSAIRQVDGVLLPYAPDDERDRYSATALHAMAAGKLVFTYEGVALAGVVRNRILTGADDADLGARIAEVAVDLAAARTEAKIAKATYWTTLRPSRLFAQLLYGPLILGDASGAGAL